MNKLNNDNLKNNIMDILLKYPKEKNQYQRRK